MSTKICTNQDCESTEFDVDGETYFCMECGEEINEADFARDAAGEDDPYRNVVVGLVNEASEVPKTKLTKLSINVGKEEDVIIVTNAYVKKDDRIVVALEGMNK